MATKKAKSRTTKRKAKKTRARAKPGIVERAAREITRRTDTVPKQARKAYGEVRSGVRRVEKMVAGIERDLVRAEKRIEAEARTRIAGLRREALAQRRTLERKRREALGVLSRLAAGADESWQDVKSAADEIFAEAGRAASKIAKHFRKALKA